MEEIQRFIRIFFKFLYFTELENLKEMGELLDVYDTKVKPRRSK